MAGGVVVAGVSVGVVAAGVGAASVVTAVPKSAVALDTTSATLVSTAVVVEFANGVSTWRLTTRGK